MKKYLAEMIGTMVLVLMGCGAAVFNGGCGTTAQVLTVAFAFGLSVVAMAYTIGGVSGCHINPAITLGVFLSGRMSGKDAGMYMIFQVIGAFIGSAILFAVLSCVTAVADPAVADSVAFVTNGSALATQTGSNAVAPGVTLFGGLLAEIFFTMVFVLVVLGTTDSKKGAGNFAGLAIGLSLVLVHIVCIPITGTSVNPARSISPAVFDLINGNSTALSQLWIFIVGPFVGAALSALIWKIVGKDEEAK